MVRPTMGKKPKAKSYLLILTAVLTWLHLPTPKSEVEAFVLGGLFIAVGVARHFQK